MSAHDEAVVVAAKAVCDHLDGCGDRPCNYFTKDGDRPASCKRWDEHMPNVSIAITAYLSHIRAAGYAVVRVPNAKEESGGYFGNLCVRSWNDCRAAMLEGDKP